MADGPRRTLVVHLSHGTVSIQVNDEGLAGVAGVLEGRRRVVQIGVSSEPAIVLELSRAKDGRLRFVQIEELAPGSIELRDPGRDFDTEGNA